MSKMYILFFLCLAYFFTDFAMFDGSCFPLPSVYDGSDDEETKALPNCSTENTKNFPFYKLIDEDAALLYQLVEESKKGYSLAMYNAQKTIVSRLQSLDDLDDYNALQSQVSAPTLKFIMHIEDMNAARARLIYAINDQKKQTIQAEIDKNPYVCCAYDKCDSRMIGGCIFRNRYYGAFSVLHYIFFKAAKYKEDADFLMECAQQLLQAGANVNAGDEYGETPLHLARTKEQITLLLQYGADPHKKNHWQHTPYDKNKLLWEILAQQTNK